MSGEASLGGGEQNTEERETREKEIKNTCRAILQGIRELGSTDRLAYLPPAEAMAELSHNPLLDPNLFDLLQESPVLKKYIAHDVSNLAGIIFPSLNNEKYLPNLIRLVPRFAFIMEDICLRGLGEGGIEGHHERYFTVQDVEGTLNLLLESMKEKKERKMGVLKDSRYRYLEPNTKIDVSIRLNSVEAVDFSNIKLADDEYLSGVPGAFINALSNVSRNAGGEYLKKDQNGEIILKNGQPIEVGARHIKILGERVVVNGKDFIAIEVVDDGVGMPASYLDEKDPNFIFRFGRSHRSSSGYGLTNMPDRLHSIGTEMVVWSFQRDSNQSSVFDSSGEMQKKWENELDSKQIEKDWLNEDRKRIAEKAGFQPSTVFKFLLPIKKAKYLS